MKLLCKIFSHKYKTRLNLICYGIMDIEGACERCDNYEVKTIRRNQIRYGWFRTVDHEQNDMYDHYEMLYFHEKNRRSYEK